MPEDRDQLFERALARHLRSESAAESSCLDPETLAAYHERMLSREELASAKSHIVSCVRCQDVLARLEATQEVDELQQVPEEAPAAANRAERMFAGQAREPQREFAARESAKVGVALPGKKTFTLRWAAPAGAIAAALLIWIGVRESYVSRKPPSEAATQVADSRQPAPSSAPREESKEIARPEDKAIEVLKDLQKQKSADAAAVYLNEATPRTHGDVATAPPFLDERKDSAVPGKLEREKKASPEYEYYMRQGAVGRNRGPSAATAQAQANSALQRGNQAGLSSNPQNRNAPVTPDLDDAELYKAPAGAAARKSGVLGAAAPSAAPPPPSPRAPGRLRGTVTDPSGTVIAGANVVLKSADGSAVASTSTDGSGAYSFNELAAGNYRLELQSAGFKTDVLTGLNVAAGENIMNAKLERGAATETVQVAAQAAEMAEARSAPALARDFRNVDLLSSAWQIVASPDGRTIWKFGDMGQIFHSTNAGKDWASEASGVTVKLLSASAPSPNVCWIVGAAGTLLRTSNGGKHWQKLAVPITGDIGGIRATDDKHAFIWDAPNRLGYETFDGGKTWKQSTNE